MRHTAVMGRDSVPECQPPPSRNTVSAVKASPWGPSYTNGRIMQKNPAKCIINTKPSNFARIRPIVEFMVTVEVVTAHDMRTVCHDFGIYLFSILLMHLVHQADAWLRVSSNL